MVQKGKKTFVPAREIQFNCKPVSDDDIEEFCRDYIQYYPDSLAKKEREKQIKMMIRAIKTVCQTPTGRMAFRATCYNIQQHRAQNPKSEYRLTVCFAGKSEDSVGSVNVDDSNCICLYQDTMREVWEDRFCTFRKRSNFPDDISLTDEEKEKAFYLDLGWVFFHEAQHVRQLQNPQLQGQLTHLFLDAAPQALARQIILESNSRISQWCLNITNSEVQAYRRAVDFNPETLAFDEQADPELRNAAAEFLFHAKFNVSFRTQTTVCELPGAPVEFSWWFSTTDAAGAAPYPKVPGKAPKGCTIVLPNEQEVPATLGGHAQAIRFADNASSPLTYCELRHGNLSWRIPVWCRTVNPVEVTLGEVPEVRAGKSFVLPVTIQNFQAVPANGAVRLNLPETWSVEPSHIIHYERLEYKRPKTVYVRVSVPEDVAPEMTFLTAEVIADRQSRSFAVQPSRPQIIARRAVQPIDVRNPANWPTDSAWTEVGESAPKSVKISDYRGNDDCSGRLRCAWDDQYLYVQAEVTDDVHVQKIAGEKLWGGDCIQLALCPGKANLTHGYNGREREIGLALTEGGFAFAYQWMGGPRQGILDNVPVIVKREGNQTRYCVAIPWSTLLMSAPKSGEVMSFSFTFNDNDAGSLRGWLEWTPGVCGGKDSSLFGELRFAE